MSDINEIQSNVIDLILEGHKMTEIAKETGIYKREKGGVENQRAA